MVHGGLWRMAKIRAIIRHVSRDVNRVRAGTLSMFCGLWWLTQNLPFCNAMVPILITLIDVNVNCIFICKWRVNKRAITCVFFFNEVSIDCVCVCKFWIKIFHYFFTLFVQRIICRWLWSLSIKVVRGVITDLLTSGRFTSECGTIFSCSWFITIVCC
jgi:hypothetical protein